MKVVLDIKDDAHAIEFIDMLEKLDYIDVMMQIKDKKTSQFISDLSESFDNVRKYEQGKKQLKSAKDVLNEL
ncbi:MAG: hypothetical protein WAU01_11660 [Saprospiraceae bacterium]